jgi:DNA-binding transcriptional regulator YhcF (GntR family)
VTAPPALRVVTTDPTPPYEQLRRQLAELIQAGVLAAGDRLPPLRQLAADLGLAVGTVARTYRELEAAGLVASRRGGGTRVQAAAQRATAAQRERHLQAHAETFVRQARLLGAMDDQMRAALESALAAGRAPSAQAAPR